MLSTTADRHSRHSSASKLNLNLPAGSGPWGENRKKYSIIIVVNVGARSNIVRGGQIQSGSGLNFQFRQNPLKFNL